MGVSAFLHFGTQVGFIVECNLLNSLPFLTLARLARCITLQTSDSGTGSPKLRSKESCHATYFRFIVQAAVHLYCCFAVFQLPRARALLIDSADANIAVVDFGTPTSFSFFFSKPTAGLTGLFTSTLTISGTLTDATGDGVAIGLGSLPAIAQAIIEGIGVIDLGPISSSAAHTGHTRCPPLSIPPITAVPSTRWV